MGIRIISAVALVMLFCGCLCVPESLNDKIGGVLEKPDEPFCPQKYILVGSDCCLDENENGICDSDEAQTTTTKKPTTTTAQTTSSTIVMTTSTTTSSTSSTTTTVAEVACTVNDDCGVRSERLVCNEGDLYTQMISYLCRKPGTSEAQCVMKTGFKGASMVSKASPTERCSDGCVDGACI